jgi:hypothetical protein
MLQSFRYAAMITPAALSIGFFALSWRSIKERGLFLTTALFALFGIESLFVPALSVLITVWSPADRLWPTHPGYFYNIMLIVRILCLACIGIPFLLWLKRVFRRAS